MKKSVPIIIIVAVVLFFFKPVFVQKLLPIPADTIVGLYYPFRDLYAETNPRGVPFHNFLITDPVRQQYPWRSLAISLEKNMQLPLWNPYSFAGVPLLANGQSAAFYPFNILFSLMPFITTWNFLIILEPLLGGLFMFFYLRNFKLHLCASLLGSLAFSFSSFFVAWMEWNTVVQTALWLPLLLLSIDKIFLYFHRNSKFKIQIANLQFKMQRYYIWSVIFVFSLTSSFLAGHLQTFFYVFLIMFFYFLARWTQVGFNKKIALMFLFFVCCFLLLSSFQLIPMLQFITLSARNVDQNWHQIGWFIPPQNLLQFITPDFFGNPATGNYWGIWNYAEFLGYVGIVPLIFSLFALFFRHDKKTLFFGTLFFLSLIFSVQNIIAKIPFYLSFPFLSTAQPTRLLFVADFSLAILAAFGIDYFVKTKSKKIVYPLIFISVIFIGIWTFVYVNGHPLQIISQENLLVTKHNILLPTVLFLISGICILLLFLFKQRKYLLFVLCFLLCLTVFDLYRFAAKFETFSSQKYLFPQTKILTYLQQQAGINRVLTTDDQILPPNFSVMYHLQTLDGYDPLYLRTYGELMAAIGRMKPDISTPFGFNRIITSHGYSSSFINLLGVKYVLSLTTIADPRFQKIMQDGQTSLYLNANVQPRAFFVSQVIRSSSNQASINRLFQTKFNPRFQAVVTCSSCSDTQFDKSFVDATPTLISYTENKVVFSSDLTKDGFLVFTDTFYPTWHATVDGKPTKIYLTDYTFRGIFVPEGNHTIVFYDSLF